MADQTNPAPGSAESHAFADLIEGNRRHQETHDLGGATGNPVRKLAVVMCMDTRLDPLAALGLRPGDAKILRNAGGRVTDDVLRGLALATNLLGVERIAVVEHTDCAVAKNSEAELRAGVEGGSGAPATGWDFLAIPDQRTTIQADVEKVRDFPLIGDGVVVEGFLYDVHTGALLPVTG